MSKTKYVKYILLSAMIITITIILFLSSRFSYRIYKQFQFNNQQIYLINVFLEQNFPNEVKSFNQSLQEQIKK